MAFRADTKSYPVQHEHLSDMSLSTLEEIDMAQLRSVTEIAPKSLFLYGVTSPLGHLRSRDTSILGTQNLVPQKSSNDLCLFVTSVEGTPLFR